RACAAAASLVARRGACRGGPRLDVALAAGAVGLVAVALLLRQHPSSFAFSVRDLGGYVNGGDAIGERRWPGQLIHGFTVFLAGTNVLLGKSHTVSGLPAV